MKTKSIPACASVCRTPRARVSHRIVPSAIPPDLSVARNLLMRIALLPKLRDQFGIKIGGAFAHLAVLEAHHPTVRLMINRAIPAAAPSLPLKRELLTVRDNVPNGWRNRAAQLAS